MADIRCIVRSRSAISARSSRISKSKSSIYWFEESAEQSKLGWEGETDCLIRLTTARGASASSILLDTGFIREWSLENAAESVNIGEYCWWDSASSGRSVACSRFSWCIDLVWTFSSKYSGCLGEITVGLGHRCGSKSKVWWRLLLGEGSASKKSGAGGCNTEDVLSSLFPWL